MSAYLQDLTIRLAAGLATLPDEFRERHTEYLRRAQNADGGFSGRMGDSDLYYTSFALRGLAILGELDEETSERAATFLRANIQSHQSIVDFFSLIYSAALLYAIQGIDIFADSDPDWDKNVAKFLRSLQRDDGGFAKAHEGHAGSTYHTFLVLLVLQLIGEPVEDPERIIKFLLDQKVEEGGFREIRAARRAGTNPTAAAVATLKMLDRLDDSTIDSTLDFLVNMQSDEGGFLANTRIPVADALSTFTGMLTVDDLGEMHELEIDALQAFIDSLQLDQGGFRAAAWDDAHDVEYTFYGLGCMALLENYRRRNP
jgi:geranylgeranyl transferase type-2 subunit beta